MQCPRCQSDDIARSRRTLLDRLVLPLIRGKVFRCRDCHKRFWVGVEWSSLILGTLTLVVTAAIVLGLVVVSSARRQHHVVERSPSVPPPHNEGAPLPPPSLN